MNRILCHHPTFYRAAKHQDPEKCKKMVKLDSSHDHKKIEITKCKRNRSYTESRLAQMSKVQIQDTCEQLTAERRNHKHSLELLDGSHSCSYNVISMDDHLKRKSDHFNLLQIFKIQIRFKCRENSRGRNKGLLHPKIVKSRDNQLYQ